MQGAAREMRSAVWRRLTAALAVSAALPASRAYALPPAVLSSPGEVAPGELPGSVLPPTTSSTTPPTPPPAAEGPAPVPPTGAAAGAPAFTAPAPSYGLQTPAALPAALGGLRIQPSLGVQEWFTDNVFQTPTHKQSDFITGITPSLSLTDNTPRVQAAAQYSPTGLIYARNSSQDTITQNFSGQATVTLVPDTLYLEALGYVSTVATNGGFAPGTSTTFLNRNNSSTVTGFTISPYAVHRFGDLGVGEIGVTLGEASTSGGHSNAFNGFNNPNGNTQSIEETAQFTTGEILPRTRDITLFDAYQSTGNVGTQTSTQFRATNRVEYALNPKVVLIGEAGYENLRFSGIPPIRISDAVWQVGARWDPNPASTITVLYGHQNGIDSPYVSARFALTARTTFYATYTEGLGTDQTLIQNNLDLATLNPYGQFVNSQTAGPLFITNNLLGLNNNLYRQRTLTVSTVTSLDRDTITFSGYRQEQSPLAVAVAGQNATELDGISGGATWTHALSEVSNVSVRGDYGTSTSKGALFGVAGPATKVAVFDLSATYSRQFTRSLSGLAQYVYTHQTSNTLGLGFVQNLFLVAVQKTF